MEHLFDGDLAARWSFFGINVLMQLTIIGGLSLAAAAFLRRRTAERHALLLGTLLLILGLPLFSWLIPMGSIGFVQLSLTEANKPRGSLAPSTDSATVLREHTPAGAETWPMERAPAPERPPAGEVPPSRDGSLNVPVEVAKSAREPGDNRLAMSVDDRGEASIIHRSEPRNQTAHWLRTVPVILLLWFLGTLFLLVRIIVIWTRLRRCLRKAVPVRWRRSNQVFVNVCQSFGISAPLPLLESPEVVIPFAAGLRVPCVVLPAGLCELVSPEVLEHLLHHEVAHVVRRDPAVVLLQNVASAFFWFHPFIHLLNRQLAQAREQLCDNHVLRTALPHDYSRTLLLLAEGTRRLRPLAGGVGLFTSGWRLESRIAGILDERRALTTQLTGRRTGALATLLVLIGAVAAAGTVSPATERSIASETNGNAAEALSQVEPAKPGWHPFEIVLAENGGLARELQQASAPDSELDQGRVDDPAEKMRLIDMLARADRASRESIVTWTGSGAYTASQAWQAETDSGSPRVFREARLEFAIDRRANRLFVEWNDVQPVRFVKATGEPGEFLTRNLARFRSIVNEKWFDFRTAAPYRGQGASLLSFDASAKPRVLMIRPADAFQNLRHEEEGMVNPLLWGSINGRRVQQPEPFFADQDKWLKERYRNERRAGKPVDPYEFCDVLHQQRESGPVIVLRRFWGTGGRPVRHAPETLTSELTFDERHGLALTRCEYFMGRQATESAEIEHEKRGDLSIPVRFTRKVYGNAGASDPTEFVEIRLEESQINQPVSETWFDVDRLELQEGDRIIKTEGDQRFVVREGKWAPVESPPKGTIEWQPGFLTSVWFPSFVHNEQLDLWGRSYEFHNRLARVEVDSLSSMERKAHFERIRVFCEQEAERYLALHTFEGKFKGGWSLESRNTLGDVIRMEYAGPVAERAAEMLLNEEIIQENQQSFAMSLAYSLPTSLAAETVLRGMIEKNELRPTRAQAHMSLARVLAENAQRKRMMALPARAERIAEEFGEWYVNRVMAIDADAAEREAEKLCHIVIDEFPDVMNHSGEEPLSKQAHRDLRRLQHAIGRRAPEIEGRDFSGNPLRLSETDGKVRVLMFWGNWCPPCRDKYPRLRELMVRCADAPFELLGICSDKNKPPIRVLVDEGQITWRFWWDHDDTPWRIHNEWGLGGAPWFFVLDARGIVRFADINVDELEGAVELLLKEMATTD